MNKIVCMLLALLLSGCAGMKALPPSDMTIQQVIEIPNTSKNVLFDRSRMWYASSFKSANAVIQYENKENGTIMGNGVVSDTHMTVRFNLRFSLATEVKDNKARITATGQSLWSSKYGEGAINRRMWEKFRGEIDELVTSYVHYIQKPELGANSDW